MVRNVAIDVIVLPNAVTSVAKVLPPVAAGVAFVTTADLIIGTGGTAVTVVHANINTATQQFATGTLKTEHRLVLKPTKSHKPVTNTLYQPMVLLCVVSFKIMSVVVYYLPLKILF